VCNEFVRNDFAFGTQSGDGVSQVPADAARDWPTQVEIGLLFIDASHDYVSVGRDYEFWSPFVAVNGFVTFDDVPGWPGPTRLVGELPGWHRMVT
jgi:hypothetical protein